MRLIELRLKDFRQFEGKHTVSIAPDGDKNVTVVYGTNGSGKTTLLNAFTWCLYGSLSDDFMFPKRLISDTVWNRLPLNATASAEVALEFEHNDDYFTLTRTARAAKVEDGPEQTPVEESILVRRTAIGAVEVKNPKDFVDSILPDRLHHFFFMNGERFDHLLSANAYQDIEGAIKTILGLEVIERGIAHLKDVEKRLNVAYRKLASTKESEILERLSRANDQKDSQLEAISSNESQQRLCNEEIATLDNRLRELEGSRALQAERDRLVSRYETITTSSKSLKASRLDLLGSRGFLAFMPSAAQAALAKYEEMRQRREIPRGIKDTFVQDLLELGTCVCGTDVSRPGEARSALEAWMQKAGRGAYEEHWMSFAGKLKEWSEVNLPDLRDRLAEIDAQLARNEGELSGLDQRLSELSHELVSADQETIRELEDSRKRSRESLNQLTYRRAHLDLSYRNAVIEITGAESDLRKAQAASAEAEIAQRRVVAVEDVRAALETLRELRTDDVRRELDSRIKRVYAAVVKKKQTPALSSNFELLLQEPVDGQLLPKAKSTGEAQVLTLSFVGALADLAKSTYDDSKDAGANSFLRGAGGIFPFAADAIFGTLDESFRRDVARLLPTLAPQVVLFLSKQQAGDEVHSELGPRIGSVAVIEERLAKIDAQPETLFFEGREYPYVSAVGGDGDTSAIVTITKPEV